MKKFVTIAAVAALATLAACSKEEAPVDTNATEAATDNATDAAPVTLGGPNSREGEKTQVN